MEKSKATVWLWNSRVLKCSDGKDNTRWTLVVPCIKYRLCICTPVLDVFGKPCLPCCDASGFSFQSCGLHYISFYFSKYFMKCFISVLHNWVAFNAVEIVLHTKLVLNFYSDHATTSHQKNICFKSIFKQNVKHALVTTCQIWGFTYIINTISIYHLRLLFVLHVHYKSFGVWTTVRVRWGCNFGVWKIVTVLRNFFINSFNHIH